MKVIIDEHPGKWHEGLELTPVLVAAPGYTVEEYRFFTGLQLDEVTEQGMFSKYEQPIQVISPLDTKLETCTFTMSMVGMVTAEQIKILVETGYCLVNEDPYYRIELFL